MLKAKKQNKTKQRKPHHYTQANSNNVNKRHVPHCIQLEVKTNIRYDFRINTMFGSSLPPAVCSMAHVLLTLFVFVRFVFTSKTKTNKQTKRQNKTLSKQKYKTKIKPKAKKQNKTKQRKRLFIVKHVELNRTQHFTTYMRFSAV
jgi:hypothetical protein